MSDLLNKASLVVIPSGYKEDTVYSVVPSDGSGDLSFTRASNGTRINSAGLVEVVPWNLFGYSEDFSNGYWTNSLGTITANVINAPNGTLTADLFTKTSAVNTVSQVRSPVGVYSQTGIYTLSVYAKQNVGNLLLLRLDNDNNTANAQWDFSTKSFTNSGANIISSSFEELSNGWFRLIVTGNVTSTTWTFSIANLFFNPTNDSVYIWGAQLNIGSTAKPYFPTTDRLNVPRLTYQNGGGGCPSLLLEKQSTNGLYPSEDFSTTWNLFNSATITTNQATSPDGTQNADKLTTANSANALYNVNDAGSSAGDYTASIFVKPINNNSLGLGMTNDTTGEAFVLINVATGVGTTTSQTGWSNATYTWQQHANGWYRITITATKGSSGAARFILKGNSSSDYYIWGAQIEASSYPTSYIPTTSSSATRVADAVPSKSTLLADKNNYSMFLDFYPRPTATFSYFFIQKNSSDSAEIIWGGTSDYLGFSIYDYTVSQTVWTGNINDNNRHKICLSVASGKIDLFVDGVQVVTQKSTSQTGFYLVAMDGGPGVYKINEMVILPKITSTEAIALTTI